MTNPKNTRRRLSPNEIRMRRNQDHIHRDAPTLPVTPAVTPAGPTVATTGTEKTTQPNPPAEPARNPDPFTAPTPERQPLARKATVGKDANVFILKRNGHIDVEDRRAFLQRINPEGRADHVRAVKPTVIDLIEKTTATSADSLRNLMTHGCAFAVWWHIRNGSFNPEEALTGTNIEAYIEHRTGQVAALGTIRSALRRLAGNRPAKAFPRKKANAPHTRREEDRFWDTALDLDDWVGVETRTLLALTFGAGCRAGEIYAMHAGQIDASGRRTVVLATKDHILREIPVYGEYAQWLRERARQLHPDALLFRTTYVGRRDNAISDLKFTTRKKGVNVFDTYDANRARHTWLCRNLNLGIEFNALCTAADINAGSKLLQDLAPYLPTASGADVRRAFDRAHNSHRTREESA